MSKVNVALSRTVVLSTLKRPLVTMPRRAIVKVCDATAVEANTTFSNSSSPPRFAPANVIVQPVALSNVTVAEPPFQDADVEEFVHVPETVHAPLPKEMKLVTEEMLTLPVTATVPDVLVRFPPLIVSVVTDVIANVVLANVPLEMMSSLVTVIADASVQVNPAPAVIVKSSKVLSVESIVKVPELDPFPSVTIPVRSE